MLEGWTDCRGCSAPVRIDADECGLCLRPHPAQRWRNLLELDAMLASLGRNCGRVLGAVVGGHLAAGLQGGAFVAVTLGGAAAGALMTGAVGELLGGWLDERLQTGAPRPGSIAELQRLFERRSAELKIALVQIDASLKRVAATVTDAGQPGAIAALQHARAATEQQLERYGVETQRAQLATWQAHLAPIAQTWRGADHDTCEVLLQLLLQAVRDGEAMRKEWTAGSVPRSERAQRGKARVMAALDEGLQTCESLRQGLLMRQAQTLAEGSPGVLEAFAAEAAALPAADRGGAIAEQLKALTGELPELEEERLRLAAELSAIAEVQAEFGDEAGFGEDAKS